MKDNNKILSNNLSWFQNILTSLIPLLKSYYSSCKFKVSSHVPIRYSFSAVQRQADTLQQKPPDIEKNISLEAFQSV